MRSRLLASSAAAAFALSFGFATTASADVTILVDVTKTKTITIVETIIKTKIVDVNVVTPPLVFDSAAEAMAIVNARNENGEVNGFFNDDPLVGGLVDHRNDPEFDYEIFVDATIINSINGNTGIVGVNQDAGNMANQGNVVSLAATGRPPEGTTETPGSTSNPSFVHSQAAVDQRNTNNLVFDSEFLSTPGDPALSTPNRVAQIGGAVEGEGAINGNSGIVGVNQNVGNFANQHNVVAIAIGFEGAVALSEASLGQVSSGNQVREIETVKYARITNSANGNSGIVAINQNTGNANNQAHVVSISGLTSPVSVGIPFGG